MKRRIFLGYCFCDSRFRQLEEIIKNGTLDEVLAIQQINEELRKSHRYEQVAILLKERLNG